MYGGNRQPTGVSKWKFMLQNDINSIFREKEKQRKLETGATKVVIAITINNF